MELLPLYLKKVTHNNGFDVMAYKEPECVHPVAHWACDNSQRPDKRNKTVMFNCYKWKVVWL